MGPVLFDYGYGPFRWVCLSGKPEDLDATDQAAMDCIDPNRRAQDRDNWVWIRDAKGQQAGWWALRPGSSIRTPRADQDRPPVQRDGKGRKDRPGDDGRDHHDVSGTDSCFPGDIQHKDGSNVMADMAVQCLPETPPEHVPVRPA